MYTNGVRKAQDDQKGVYNPEWRWGFGLRPGLELVFYGNHSDHANICALFAAERDGISHWRLYGNEAAPYELCCLS